VFVRDDPPAYGEKGTLKHVALGCYSREIFERFFKIILAKDSEASKKFMSEYIPTGDCELMKEGAEVTVARIQVANA
jgi:hypothetical protein